MKALRCGGNFRVCQNCLCTSLSLSPSLYLPIHPPNKILCTQRYLPPFSPYYSTPALFFTDPKPYLKSKLILTSAANTYVDRTEECTAPGCAFNAVTSKCCPYPRMPAPVSALRCRCTHVLAPLHRGRFAPAWTCTLSTCPFPPCVQPAANFTLLTLLLFSTCRLTFCGITLRTAFKSSTTSPGKK